MRWFSIGVIGYMILGIIWWGMLLYNKNNDLYTALQSVASPDQLGDLKSERAKQNLMIIGEGIVLGLSLLAGIFIINRSANREIRNAKLQSNFLLSVSHELKSPIAAIKLALETLRRPKLPVQSASKITTSAVKDANRLEKLVQNILLSATIEESKLELYKEEVNLNTFITTLLDQIPTAARGIQLTQEGQTNDTSLIDRYYLQQTIMNIVDNAIKYARSNTEIIVSLTSTEHQNHVHITNVGYPIPDKEKKAIFEKFYRGQQKEIR
ncbi:MAG: HAMP domain-containing sensor histidine kinase, partial [Bacteroidota bacterium]